jgi:radical SAM protein with 4Fe4S-binding SPASM domain
VGFFRKKSISFIMNNYCNSQCIYCPYFGRGGIFRASEALSISTTFAKCGVDDFFKRYPYRNIRFMGIGEPTLDFDKIREITRYADQVAGETVHVEIQTNGQFGQNVAEWFFGRPSMVWISMDGLAEVQDYYRPRNDGQSSFAIVDRNIIMLQSSRKSVLGIRATIGRKNIDRQKELIDYARSRQISTIYVEPLGPFERCIDEAVDVLQFAETFSESLEYAENLGITYSTWALINFDEEVDVSCRTCLPMPHLLPDGYVSACDMANTKNTKLQDLIYGRYEETENRIHYFEDKIEIIKKRNIHNLPKKCGSCEMLRHCAGGCVGVAYWNSGSLYGIHEESCQLVRFLARRFPHKINAGYDPNIPLHP